MTRSTLGAEWICACGSGFGIEKNSTIQDLRVDRIGSLEQIEDPTADLVELGMNPLPSVM